MTFQCHGVTYSQKQLNQTMRWVISTMRDGYILMNVRSDDVAAVVAAIKFFTDARPRVSIAGPDNCVISTKPIPEGQST